jgi:hypothetical protein
VANAVHKFKDRDVKRVIRASQQAGIEIDAVEVDPTTGKIKVIISKSGEASGNDLDHWIAKKQKDARPT